MVTVVDNLWERPMFAVGYAEFTMDCPAEVTETMTCTGLGLEPLVVNATVWVPEPEPEPESDEE